MIRFYDPLDDADQARVESLLREKGVEYFLGPREPTGPRQILVAEEDLPFADALLKTLH